MNKQAFIVSGILCLFNSYVVRAQENKLTLLATWQKVYNQYPSLIAKKAAIEEQVSNKELVKKEQLPDIHVQFQQSYGSYGGTPGAFFPLAGIYNISGNNKPLTGQPSSFANMYASTVLDWNFIQFGRIKKKIDAATYKIKQAGASLDNEKFRLQSLSTRQYFKILYNTEYFLLVKDDINRLRKLLELSKSQVAAGLHPGADSLLAQSTYLQSKGEANDAQDQLKTALIQLASLMGVNADSIQLDKGNYIARQNSANAFAVDSLVKHPYLQHIQSKIESSKATLHVIQREPYPSIGFLAGTGIRGSGIQNTGMVDNNFSAPWQNNTANYLVGIGATWNFSSLYNNKTRQKIISSQIKSEEADYADANLQLAASYRSAFIRWEQQQEKIKDSREAYQAAKEAYDLYLSRYESGLTNMVEILQLQKTVQDAERSLLSAISQYWDELINQSEAFGNFSILLQEFNN